MAEQPKNEAGRQQVSQSTADQILAAAQEAVEKAQETIEKIQQEGNKLLGSLLKEGEKVIDETQKMAGGSVEEVRNRVEMARGKTADTFDNLEKIFEERVSRALGRLGIPTREDFQTIAKRLEELNQSVRTLIREERVEEGVERLEEEITESHVLDDLKEINGVGPAMEAKLNSAGITSYRQLAELDAEGTQRLDAVIKSAGRIIREDWVGQAKALHFEKYHEQL